MLNDSRLVRIGVVFCALFLARCSLLDEKDQKRSNTGLIVTPVASYSTLKARNLAQKYKDSLERFVVEVVRNPTTGKLQLANNITSTGGIGFFTHSASKAVDERYLELIVAVPEVFDERAGLNSKIDRLMSQYGTELLGILVRDSAIYGDQEVAGYGLNFSWRNVFQGQTGSQIVFERSVLYFNKDDARGFLDHKMTKEALLSGAAIFVMRGEAPPQQVAYAGPDILSPSNTTGREEKPPESTIASLKAEVTEKDISAEKDNKIEEKEQKTSPKPAGIKRTEAARAPGSDGPKKEPEVSALPADKQAQETSGKAAVVMAKEKTEHLPTTVERGEPSVTSGPQDSASARASGATYPQTTKSGPETVKETSEKATASSLKIERSPEVEKPVSRDVEPSSTAPKSDQVPEMPIQRQVDKSANAALSKQTVIENKPAKAVAEANVPEQREAKEKSAKIPEPARVAKPAEQTANKIATQETESFQEATLRKDLPHEVTGKKPEDAGSGREATEKSRETSREKLEAGGHVAERTEKGLSTASIQPDKPAAKAPQAATEVRVALKSVEGYAVQLSFPQKTDAQRWSETLSREGYTTSITSIGEADSVRLRVGSFSSAEAAKSLLGRLQKQGLTGFVIQVPKG